jgi:hypothetical protein
MVKLWLVDQREQVEVHAIDFKLQHGVGIRPMELVRKIEGPMRTVFEDGQSGTSAPPRRERPPRGIDRERPGAALPERPARPPRPARPARPEGSGPPGQRGPRPDRGPRPRPERVPRPDLSQVQPPAPTQPTPASGEAGAEGEAKRRRRRRGRRRGAGGGGQPGEAPSGGGNAGE